MSANHQDDVGAMRQTRAKYITLAVLIVWVLGVFTLTMLKFAKVL